MRRVLAGLLATFLACHHTAPSVADAAPAPIATTPMDATRAAVADASKPITPEDRKTYAAALALGRKLTVSKKYPEAIAAFTRALGAIPDDGRATSERGYARYLAKDYDHAEADFQLALTELGDGDKKVLAQVEFNLGLLASARGRDGAAHFHRSYDLSPTAAAKARMGTCPATTRVPATTIYASEAAARAKLADLAAMDATPGAFESEVGEGNGSSAVLVPIDGGKLAAFDVGLLGMWRCGTLGELELERDGTAWKITYQAHRGTSSPGICACDDGAPCNSDYGYNDPAFSKCTCASPMCPSVCGGAELPEGQHVVAWIDARTGAGLGAVEVDHEYVDKLKIEGDVAARSFKAVGMGCP